MTPRSSLLLPGIAGLFIAVLIVSGVRAQSPGETGNALGESAPAPEPEGFVLPQPRDWLLPGEVPPGLEPVLKEMQAGRFWHAGRLLDESLDSGPRTPEETLLAARAAAGWGSWTRVRALLREEPWLDELDGGAGLALLARAAEAAGAWEEAASSYARYLELARGGEGRTASPVARIRRALSLARGGEVEPALEELAGIGEARGAFVASWSAAATARVLAEEGDPDGTRRALNRVTDQEARTRSGALVATAHLQAGDSAGAVEAFRRAAESADGAEAARLRVVLADLVLARGDTVAGTALLERAIEARSVEAAGRLVGLGALADGEAARTAADLLLRADREEEGLEALELSMELLNQGPDDLSPGLRLLRARLLGLHGSPEEAATELARLAESDTASVAGPALWHLARLRRRQGRPGEARALEDRLVREVPHRPEAVDVVFFRGDDAQDRGRLEAAARHYREAVNMAPALNRSGLARMRLGQIHLERGDLTGAVEVFEGYLADFPEGRRWEEASYWAARSRLELGDSAEARDHLSRIRNGNPLSYYAVLTAELLGLPYEPWDSLAAGGAPDPDALEWVAGGLEDVEILRAAGLEEGVEVAVERLVARARSHDPAGPALLSLAQALNGLGLTMEGITLGWEIRGAGRPWDLRLLRVVFPLPYREMLVREAAEWGVDPFLAAGIIRQESAFWHQAVSRAGAVGLMQVMPATGSSLAGAVGPRPFTPDALTVPEINLHLGARFLRDMMDRFGPDLPLVLSAYNAGPSRADRWRDLPEAEDPLRFTERIPFRETRGYVKNVVRNRALYEWLYGEGEPRE